jgi:hypothetical protein
MNGRDNDSLHMFLFRAFQLPSSNRKCVPSGREVGSEMAADGWIVPEIYWKPIRKFRTGLTLSRKQIQVHKADGSDLTRELTRSSLWDLNYFYRLWITH